MSIFVYNMFFKGTVMQFRTLKLRMVQFAVKTIKNFIIGFESPRLVSKEAEVFIIELTTFETLESLLPIQVVQY